MNPSLTDIETNLLINLKVSSILAALKSTVKDLWKLFKNLNTSL